MIRRSFISSSRQRRTCLFSLAAWLVVAGCEGDAARTRTPDAASGSPDAGSSDGALEVPPEVAPAPRRCVAPAGKGTPATIAATVDLINSLPRPVTVECFLESLDRPLYAEATRSVISLQPALGNRSPRVFLITTGLIMSWVPDGKGARLVEFGEFVTPTRTLKGEIAFPVMAELGPAAPYSSIKSGTGTTCRFCHREEERALTIPFADAFISGAFRPDWRSRVELADLRNERVMCDPVAEPDRCALLRAFFDHGPVEPREFPPGVPTIFE